MISRQKILQKIKSTRLRSTNLTKKKKMISKCLSNNYNRLKGRRFKKKNCFFKKKIKEQLLTSLKIFWNLDLKEFLDVLNNFKQ